MKVLVCGSRDWFDYPTIRDGLQDVIDRYGVFEVIHGAARGADGWAGIAAEALRLPVTEFPADWVKHGKAAGPIRNRQMLDERPDLVLAFQHNGSRGTQDTIDEARRRGIPVEVFTA